ncbi:MAG TPA: MMPL family transporter, partial [Gaiellales bacterium]|nr:MMPL family transporter [Gaiellales bacterium]
MLYRLGHLVAAHPVIVIVFWIALAAGVTLTVKQVGADTDNNVSLPGTGSQAATDLLQVGFPPQQNGSNPIIFQIRGAGKVTDKHNKQAITDSYKAIKKIKYVHSATSPFAQGAGAQISKDKKTAFISVLLNVSSNDLTEQQAQRVLDAAKPGTQAGMEVVGGGSIGSTLSPNDTSTSDVIGILAAMIILTFTFGTLVAMGMPIGTAILGLTTALGLIGLMGHLVSVPDISTTIATMIGLAVGIDYALFLVTRHRGQMREGMEIHESIALAVGTAGTAVVFAGCTVVVALLSLFVAGIPLVAALGYTAAVAVGTAVLAAVTLLPALMSLAGRHIDSLALPVWLHPKDDPTKEGIWGRWAGFVTRRPLIPVLLAVALMVPLIVPVLSLELGQEDVGQTNPASMQRRAYDLMSQAYGPGFNGPLIIAVAVAPKAKGDPKVV